MLALGVIALALPNSVFAKSKKAKTTTTDTTATTTEAVTPPAGAGPGEAVIGVAIAPITTIQKRGHVNNMCESQVMTNELIRMNGTMRTLGDYKIAYLVDAPKGWYEPTSGTLAWRPPAANETQHIEAVILDSLTGKPVPVTGVTVDVLDARGNVVQSKPLVYYWHPMSDHYGTNFSIPTAGNYSLRVRAPAPVIRRHDRSLGNRFTTPVDVTFTNVRLTPMRPNPADMAPAGAGPGPIIDECDQPGTSTDQDTKNLEGTDSDTDTKNTNDQPTTPPDKPDDSNSGSDNSPGPPSE